jgi:site-specific DNA-methyltransferase (adenine-specific)
MPMTHRIPRPDRFVPGHQRGDEALLGTGDAVARLSQMRTDNVDCVVTSPPYWGLRSYPSPSSGAVHPRPVEAAGEQIGQERSVEGYLESLAAVFDQLTRVLRPSGTAWVNLGDTYGGSWGNYVANGSHARTAAARRATTQGPGRPPQTRSRPKDLQGVPWRVALMLTERGWRLRAAIAWHKPNARPESVRDRLAQRHEMLFLLSLTDQHWWHPAHTDTTEPDTNETVTADPDTTRSGLEGGLLGPGQDLVGLEPLWSISAPRARTGHLAPGSIELARRCLRHGCPPGGIVLDPFCGSGTTGLAAVEMGHRFVGIDLDPLAIDLTAARMASLVRYRAPVAHRVQTTRSGPADEVRP